LLNLFIGLTCWHKYWHVITDCSDVSLGLHVKATRRAEQGVTWLMCWCSRGGTAVAGVGTLIIKLHKRMDTHAQNMNAIAQVFHANAKVKVHFFRQAAK